MNDDDEYQSCTYIIEQNLEKYQENFSKTPPLSFHSIEPSFKSFSEIHSIINKIEYIRTKLCVSFNKYASNYAIAFREIPSSLLNEYLIIKFLENMCTLNTTKKERCFIDIASGIRNNITGVFGEPINWDKAGREFACKTLDIISQMSSPFIVGKSCKLGAKDLAKLATLLKASLYQDFGKSNKKEMTDKLIKKLGYALKVLSDKMENGVIGFENINSQMPAMIAIQKVDEETYLLMYERNDIQNKDVFELLAKDVKIAKDAPLVNVPDALLSYFCDKDANEIDSLSKILSEAISKSSYKKSEAKKEAK